MEKSLLLVSECLRYGWVTFKSRPWFFVGTVVVYLVVQGLVALVEEGAPNIITGLLSVVVSTLLYTGVVHTYLKAHDNTGSPTLKDLWNPKPFINYFLLSILLGVIIIVGLVLLIVPGIIFLLMFSFAGFLVVEKNSNPIEALKESARLTKGHRVKLLMLILACVGLGILGAIPFMLGLFIVLPVSMLALIHAYRTLSGGALVLKSDTPETPVTPA